MSLFSSIKSKVSGQAPKLKKRVFDPEKMSIEDISLPMPLRAMDIEVARSLLRDEIKTYESLKYVDLPLDQLKFPEYHSFQVGVILRYLKDDLVFLIPKADKIIPSAAMHLPKRQLHIKVFDMIYRYNEVVAKDAYKDDLVSDVRWTPLELAYLLRYVSMEDRSIAKK